MQCSGSTRPGRPPGRRRGRKPLRESRSRCQRGALGRPRLRPGSKHAAPALSHNAAHAGRTAGKARGRAHAGVTGERGDVEGAVDCHDGEHETLRMLPPRGEHEERPARDAAVEAAEDRLVLQPCKRDWHPQLAIVPPTSLCASLPPKTKKRTSAAGAPLCCGQPSPLQ